MDGEPRSALDDPLAPLPHPIGFGGAPAPPTTRVTVDFGVEGPDTSFNVSHYAQAHGILVTTLRSKLRKAGYHTPYTRADCEAILGR